MTQSAIDKLTGRPSDAETKSGARDHPLICPHGFIPPEPCRKCKYRLDQIKKMGQRRQCMLCDRFGHDAKLCPTTAVGRARKRALRTGVVPSLDNAPVESGVRNSAVAGLPSVALVLMLDG